MRHSTLSHIPILALTLLAAATGSAQATPNWTASTGSPISWLRTTSAGAVLACNAQGLSGIDPETGSIAWTISDLANAPESGYEEIANTPFIALDPASGADQLFIVEPFGGTVVFNSAKAGITTIVSKYFLYANNAIVLVGQKSTKDPVMTCVDMANGSVRWTKESGFSRLTSCTSAGPDAILVSTLFFAYRLNAMTGEEVWKRCPDPKFENAGAMSGLLQMLDKGGANLMPDLEPVAVFVTTAHAPDLCFMAMQTTTRTEKTDSQGKKTMEVRYNTFVNAFRITDGSYAWTEPLQFNNQLGAIVPLERGLLVGAADRKSVDMLDYPSGNGLWGKNGKGINVKGPLSGAVEIGDKTLLTSGKEDAVAMLVDGNGTDLWKKPLKLDGAIRSVILRQGSAVIASAEEADVVDLASGLSLIDGPFKGGDGLVARKGEDTFLFNTKTGLLYELPAGASSVKAISSTELKFDGKEKPTTLEITDAGYIVGSDQNLALIATDGALTFNRYVPAVREPGLTRALKYASAVRAAYYTAAFGYTSAAFGAVSQNIQVTDAGSAAARDITGAVSEVYGDAARTGMDATKKFLQEANARFKATASTSSIQFMLTDLGKRQYALKAVSKVDGSDLATIPVGNDKAPQYEVDSFTNTVYLTDGGDVKAFGVK
ncbi:MAG: PQQ-binding-like beta-propeller repeat protein [Flavobacteriales bacterium]|nr:PQQ-binding-like beta-propeller repeat protein [Flavobacteriales bacterium]MCB9168223.1 PQQ-binding-like beta-propeller repeat protein [Flavobacteriales bacterium]